ncbi:MAG: TonB family protein [Candidatus Omnitrophica bacterium]|nr:TonB family protein [Candidatus Omnitrophota bacterium]
MKTITKLYKNNFYFPITVILFGLLIFGIPRTWAQDLGASEDAVDTLYMDEVNMVLGELTQLKVYSLTRLSMTDPEIADILDASDGEVLLIAKNIGQTPLFIWDENGKRVIMINVSGAELSVVKDRIQKLLNDAELDHVYLSVNKNEGKVVITGTVPDYKESQYQDIVSGFDQHIMSLVEQEDIEDLVQVDVQITELNTTLSKSLGIDWSGGSANGFAINFEEELPEQNEFKDMFKIGDFSRTDTLLATVNALLEEGMGRILSQPKLVVLSGEPATFLVGGEIPIRTTTSTGTATQENVQFKEYGVGMTITPTIRKNKIDIVVNLEISDVDASNAVGDDVAFVTRSASTQVFLDDGQTIVLAGLIQHKQSELVKKVPFLGNIPFVGIPFRSRSTPTPDTDTELVISLTPHRIDTGLNPLTATEKAQKEQAPRSITPRTVSATEPKSVSTMIPDEMKDYVREVQKKISQRIIYPAEAKESGWEGTVKLGLHILSDGTLAYALVKESSGHEIFDDYALDTAKNSAPYDGFPANSDLQELNVTIPIVYSLQRN